MVRVARPMASRVPRCFVRRRARDGCLCRWHGPIGTTGGDIGWWPPTWHTESQQWLISRFPPQPEHVHVAEPVDLNEYRPGGMPALGTASDGYSARHSMDAVGMDWIYRQVDFPHPARDGSDRWSQSPSRNRGASASDGSTGSARKGRGKSTASDGSTGSPRKGTGKATASDGWKGKGTGKATASHGWKGKGTGKATASDGWKGKGKGKASDGSEAASSSDRAYICAWERREHKGPNPTAPPNPDRYIARGYAATQRRLQRRQMARDGQEIPEHLQPRKLEIAKSLKRQMYELQQRARRMASGELTEQDVEEEEQNCADWIELNRMEQQRAKEEKKKRLKEVKEEPVDYDGNATMTDAQEEMEEEKPEEEEEEEEKPEKEEEEEEKPEDASDGKDAEKPRRQWHSKARTAGTPATGAESGTLGEPKMADGKEKKASDGDNKKKKKSQRRKKERSPKDLQPNLTTGAEKPVMATVLLPGHFFPGIAGSKA